MAEFTYMASYEGGKHFSKEDATRIIDSVNSLKISGGRINKKKLPHCDFGYQLWLDDSKVVYCGIKELPGMLAGTQGLSFTFAGLEVNILSAKDLILKKMDGLELR